MTDNRITPHIQEARRLLEEAKERKPKGRELPKVEPVHDPQVDPTFDELYGHPA